MARDPGLIGPARIRWGLTLAIVLTALGERADGQGARDD